MEIKRVGSQTSGKGPSEWFTGTVRIDPRFTAPDPALVAGASVTLARCSNRLAYTSTRPNTHRYSRHWVGAARCGPIEEIYPFDVIWFAPNEKHWHGATPTTAMTHIAIQEKKDGKVVDWMDHVTSEQYSR